MKTSITKVTIRLMHNSSLPNASWCIPVGWEPSNVIEGSEYVDGSWWGDDETAGIVYFGIGNHDEEEIEVNLDDLRIVSCGDCRVIGEVTL